MSFSRNERKIRINTITSPLPPHALSLVYGEPVTLVEGLIEEEVTTYWEANLDFVPLFKINVLEVLSV